MNAFRGATEYPVPVKQEILITTEAIDGPALAAARASGPGMGAVVHFLGVVRGSEEGASIEAIDYTAFVPMAEVQFRKLLDEAARRWPLESVRVVHRLGVVRVGEPSLWMEVVSPHRAEAFDACRWIIDEMKRVVPIWKRAVPVVA
jgi:molybdopterin synthase catalytic subunit